MTEFADLIARTAADHRVLAYGLACLLAMAQGLPGVGTLVPGSLVIVGFGALVPVGALDFLQLAVASTLGAILGDGTSYWLGRRYHEAISRVWPFRRHPGRIAKSAVLLRTHGRKAVFASRFVQGLRAFVPLAAGIADTPAPRFFAVIILSALIWAPLHILVGALIGGSIMLADAIATRLAVLLVFVGALVWLAVGVTRGAVRLAPRIPASLRTPVVSRAQRKLAMFVGSGGSPAGVFLAIVATVALMVFLAILASVVAAGPLAPVDAAVHHFLQGLRTSWSDRLFIAVTEHGDKSVITLLAVAVFLWLVLRRAWRAAAYWVGGLIFARAFVTLLKITLQVPRPAPIYEGWGSFAFPSGHATMSAVLWGLFTVLVAREVKPKWRPWIFGASLGIVLLIGFSRLYLGAHWLSDVVGGLAFGIAWVALLAVFYLRRRPRRIDAKGLVAVVCSVFVLTGFVHVRDKFPEDARRYAVKTNPVTVALAEWRTSRWRTLPIRRVDLEGEDEEPLTIQWIDDPGRLADGLMRNGWRRPAPWSAQSALSWLDPQAAPDALPVLAKLHDGRVPVLTLVRTSEPRPPGASRLVLRLWDSGLRVSVAGERPRPVWIGEAVAEKISGSAGLFAIARMMPDFDGPLTAFAESLPSNAFVTRRRDPGTGWSGQILLGGWKTGATGAHMSPHRRRGGVNGRRRP
ncbi:MAG: phosphatase PAP2 family protein [Alphaproteobacteria bacterium]